MNIFNRSYRKTKKFVGKFKIGQEMIVMPTATSQSRIPYKVKIIEEYIKWVDGGCIEICTEGPIYKAVMNKYLFDRLRPLNNESA